LVGGYAIFSNNDGTLATEAAKQLAANAVILPYVGIAAVVLLVMLLLAITEMPEPSKSANLTFDRTIFKHKHLVRGFLTQLFYVGAQVGIWGITINIVVELMPEISMETAAKYFLLAGTILFVIGRFVGTFILTYVKDNRLLGIYAICATLLCITAGLTSGKLAVYAILATNFFMSIMFPTIFGLGLEGLIEGRKIGGALIVMGMIGGIVLAIAMKQLSSFFALLVPIFSFVVITWFAFRGYQPLTPITNRRYGFGPS